VALPLALGFGVSSGLGATAGLITAVVAGVVAAIFGGSRFQVSGPTGAMTVVLVPIVGQFGVGAVVIVAVLAGVLVITMALARLGALVAYLPWPVVEGFTLGIAVIIFLQQIPLVTGVAAHGDSTLSVAAQSVLQANWSTLWPSLVIVAVVAAVMVLLPRWHPSIPASLIAVVLATAIAAIARLDVRMVGTLPDSLPLPVFPSVDLATIRALAGPALAVAMLCAIESLLSARVADRLAGATGARATDPDRELFGQGLATVASGLFGGMPATGAIARTAVNVRAGAQTRVAALVHAAMLLAVVYLAAPLVGRIPLAALAAVLIMTSIRMVEHRSARALLRSTRSDAAIFAITVLTTVVFDLIVAVEVGVALAAVFALRAIAANSRTDPTDVLASDGIEVYRLEGSLFFAATPRIFQNITVRPDTQVVVLRLAGLHTLDASVRADHRAARQRRHRVVEGSGRSPPADTDRCRCVGRLGGPAVGRGPRRPFPLAAGHGFGDGARPCAPGAAARAAG
jgi:SulP family sulfate permease